MTRQTDNLVDGICYNKNNSLDHADERNARKLLRAPSKLRERKHGFEALNAAKLHNIQAITTNKKGQAGVAM